MKALVRGVVGGPGPEGEAFQATPFTMSDRDQARLAAARAEFEAGQARLRYERERPVRIQVGLKRLLGLNLLDLNTTVEYETAHLRMWGKYEPDTELGAQVTDVNVFSDGELTETRTLLFDRGTRPDEELATDLGFVVDQRGKVLDVQITPVSLEAREAMRQETANLREAQLAREGGAAVVAEVAQVIALYQESEPSLLAPTG